MPITLAQAKVGMANHVDQQVIDQFRRGSMLLNALTFDNSVSPGTGGSTLTYGYTQLKTPAGADFRDINADYTDTVAELIGNAALLTKIRSCARRAGYLTHAEDAFGRQIAGYNGIPFMDMQYYYDTAEKKEKPVVPITSREYGASSSKTTVTGLTDLYAVRLGLDGFHAVSPMGGKVISTTLPDFSTAGAVKAGDVEMVAATVLKKSRAAGVLRNFKVK